MTPQEKKDYQYNMRLPVSKRDLKYCPANYHVPRLPKLNERDGIKWTELPGGMVDLEFVGEYTHILNERQQKVMLAQLLKKYGREL